MAFPMRIHFQHNRAVGIAGAICQFPCKIGAPCFYEIVASIACHCVHIPSPHVEDYGIDASIFEMEREVHLIDACFDELMEGLNIHADKNHKYLSFRKVQKVEKFLEKRKSFLKNKIAKARSRADSSSGSDSSAESDYESELSDFEKLN